MKNAEKNLIWLFFMMVDVKYKVSLAVNDRSKFVVSVIPIWPSNKVTIWHWLIRNGYNFDATFYKFFGKFITGPYWNAYPMT